MILAEISRALEGSITNDDPVSFSSPDGDGDVVGMNEVVAVVVVVGWDIDVIVVVD